jgi:hypothetical protein
MAGSNGPNHTNKPRLEQLPILNQTTTGPL